MLDAIWVALGGMVIVFTALAVVLGVMMGLARWVKPKKEERRITMPMKVERLSASAQNEMVNIVTILLGIAVGGMMVGSEFLKPETILVFVLGVVAFALDTVAGFFPGKLMCYATGKKVNPLIGAAGISAFPMFSRVVQKVGLEANPYNHLLMHAAGANVAGQIASVVAGGAVLMRFPFLPKEEGYPRQRNGIA